MAKKSTRKQNGHAEPVQLMLDLSFDPTASSELPHAERSTRVGRKQEINITDKFGVTALSFLERFQSFAKQVVEREREGAFATEQDITDWAGDYAMEIIRFSMKHHGITEDDTQCQA